MKLNAKELRELEDVKAQGDIRQVQRRPVIFILENIYDTYNVGGLFRLADALAVEKMYLCGQMEIPPNTRIKKASIGTYKVVPWEYKKTAIEAIEEVRKKQYRVVAVEQAGSSIPYTKADYALPLALLVGNETSGVTTEALSMVDRIVEIPMWGINKSLNVIVSAAIVSYWALSRMQDAV